MAGKGIAIKAAKTAVTLKFGRKALRTDVNGQPASSHIIVCVDCMSKSDFTRDGEHMNPKLWLAALPLLLAGCGASAPTDADVSEAFKDAFTQASQQISGNPFAQSLIGAATGGGDVHYGVTNTTCNQNGEAYDCTFKLTMRQGENGPAIQPERAMHAVLVKMDGKWTLRQN